MQHSSIQTSTQLLSPDFNIGMVQPRVQSTEHRMHNASRNGRQQVIRHPVIVHWRRCIISRPVTIMICNKKYKSIHDILQHDTQEAQHHNSQGLPPQHSQGQLAILHLASIPKPVMQQRQQGAMSPPGSLPYRFARLPCRFDVYCACRIGWSQNRAVSVVRASDGG